MNTATTYRGKVALFKSEKGYGFIKWADSEDDMFVHYSEIDAQGYRKLHAGQTVEFEIGPGKKSGTVEAKNVKVIG